jgi:PKD repeat protein
MVGTVLAACATLVVADSSRADQRGIWLSAPANGAVVAADEPVTLEFGTDWLTGVFPGALKLEVAHDTSFTDVVVSETYVCPAGFEPSCPSTATIGPLGDGTYAWRILWLSQPDGGPSSWIPSDVWTFGVGSAGPGPSPANKPPVARIAFAPISPHVDEPISFDASASADPDGTIVSYTWAFGNGNGAAGSPLAAASFDRSGTYAVTVVVTDNGGASAQTTIDVIVEEPVAPLLVTSPDTTPPVARALTSRGRPGSLLRLRYRVVEESGNATVDLVVRRRQRVLTTIRSSAAKTTGEPGFVLWRAPRRAGQLTLCVSAQDRAGNRSHSSCAPVWIR